MNLVSYSIRTKGVSNFARRVWTVFARFGIAEARTRRALLSTVEILGQQRTAPTFFVPAAVLARHPRLIAEVAARGAEIGVHGYIHNDYRTLSPAAQLEQTKRATEVFDQLGIPFQGFRNPYLGWNEDALDVFRATGFVYDSNEAILHDVLDLDTIPAALRDGYAKSLALFQAIPPSTYALRPRYEDGLLRLPTSIPDDEMLYDRLRITDARRLGNIWSEVMRRVYALGGVYVLNIHPERALLTKGALEQLLGTAKHLPLPVWIAPLRDIAAWWSERRQFRLTITPAGEGRWQVQAICSPRATILVRNAAAAEEVGAWHGLDGVVPSRTFVVQAARCPAVALSPGTPEEVAAVLTEQGYPLVRAEAGDVNAYAHYVDLPSGLGATRAERMRQAAALVADLEGADAPLVRFGCWPERARAALAITGDIDSVTIQDFFFRVAEVRR